MYTLSSQDCIYLINPFVQAYIHITTISNRQKTMKVRPFIALRQNDSDVSVFPKACEHGKSVGLIKRKRRSVHRVNVPSQDASLELERNEP